LCICRIAIIITWKRRVIEIRTTLCINEDCDYNLFVYTILFYKTFTFSIKIRRIEHICFKCTSTMCVTRAFKELTSNWSLTIQISPESIMLLEK